MDAKIQSLKEQYNDVLKPYTNKSKEIIIGNSAYRRDILVDSVYALKEIAESLFSCIDDIQKDATSCNVSELVNKLNAMIQEDIPMVIKNTYEKMEKDKVAEEEEVVHVEKQKHIMIVENKDNEKFDVEGWNEVVRNTLKSKLKNVPVKKTTVTKEGHGYLLFPDKTSQEKAEDALKADFNVTKDTKNQTKLLPKMKIFDVDFTREDKSTLRSAILEKNDVIRTLVDDGKTLDVIFINDKHKFAVIKVSPEIRTQIMKYGTVFIGMEAHNVKDQFHLLQCFSCQKHGHKQDSPFCPNQSGQFTCRYCGGPHKSTECSKKNDPSSHKCVNCLTHKNVQIQRGAYGHCSTSWNCPIVIREIQSLINRTDGMNGKKFFPT